MRAWTQAGLGLLTVAAGALVWWALPAGAEPAGDLTGQSLSPVASFESGSTDRRSAVRALGTPETAGRPDAENSLIAALRADGDENVRCEAARAIAATAGRSKRLTDALTIVVTGTDKDGFPVEKSDRVKAAALNALYRCMTARPESPINRTTAVREPVSSPAVEKPVAPRPEKPIERTTAVTEPVASRAVEKRREPRESISQLDPKRSDAVPQSIPVPPVPPPVPPPAPPMSTPQHRPDAEPGRGVQIQVTSSDLEPLPIPGEDQVAPLFSPRSPALATASRREAPILPPLLPFPPAGSPEPARAAPIPYIQASGGNVANGNPQPMARENVVLGPDSPLARWEVPPGPGSRYVQIAEATRKPVAAPPMETPRVSMPPAAVVLQPIGEPAGATQPSPLVSPYAPRDLPPLPQMVAKGAAPRHLPPLAYAEGAKPAARPTPANLPPLPQPTGRVEPGPAPRTPPGGRELPPVPAVAIETTHVATPLPVLPELPPPPPEIAVFGPDEHLPVTIRPPMRSPEATVVAKTTPPPAELLPMPELLPPKPAPKVIATATPIPSAPESRPDGVDSPKPPLPVREPDAVARKDQAPPHASGSPASSPPLAVAAKRPGDQESASADGPSGVSSQLPPLPPIPTATVATSKPLAPLDRFAPVAGLPSAAVAVPGVTGGYPGCGTWRRCVMTPLFPATSPSGPNLISTGR